jgi:hypothetical protein
MRMSPSLTEVEIAAFTRFAMDHDIIIDGEVGIQNATTLCDPIVVGQDSDITPQALSDSFQRVKSQLKLKSATYKKADELARNLSPEEQATYRAWANGQKLLIGIDGSNEGYQNVKSLLEWMRGNAVTSRSLDLALGNIINNPQVGQRIHFKPQPKAERPYGPGGKLNHAFGKTEEPPKAATQGQPEYIGGRKNHAYTPPEDAAKKVATQAAPDAWKQICELHLKEWVTPGQRAKLEAEYNAGIASGKSWREIGAALGQIVRGWQRGR